MKYSLYTQLIKTCRGSIDTPLLQGFWLSILKQKKVSCNRQYLHDFSLNVGLCV